MKERRVFWRMRLLIGAMLLAVLAVTGPANATSIEYLLTSDHCTGTCGTAPFGIVRLNENGSAVDVTVDLYSPNLFVKTGAVDNMAFVFNGSGVVLGDITVATHTPALAANSGTFGTGGLGFFTFGITCPTCDLGAGDAFGDDIVFSVANATITDLTVPNAKGNVFVADIYSSLALGGNGNTGAVDATTPVPEPATLLLLGSGLAGMGFFGRKRVTKDHE